MSKTCKECGHPLDDTAQVCPECGCPVENATNASADVDVNVLNEGKSTEAEATIRDYAALVLKWGNIMAIVDFVITIIYGAIGGVAQIIQGNEGVFLGILTLVISIALGYLAYIITKFIVKVIWAFITLFVNISSTLKRIEIKLDEYGTH